MKGLLADGEELGLGVDAIAHQLRMMAFQAGARMKFGHSCDEDIAFVSVSAGVERTPLI